MASDLTEGAPAGRPALDPGVLQVIRSSADQLIPLEDTFARQLRYDIATLMPDLVTRLAGEGLPFCQRLVRTMLWVAVYDQPAQVIAGVLRQAGARNWLEGFPEGQYVSVAHALVRTVRDLSEDDWSTSMGSAWISYFLWIKPYLLAGAQQAATQQAAAEQASAQQASAGLEPASPQAASPQAASPQAASPQAASPQAASPEAASPLPETATGDVDLEAVADLLGDEDEDDEDVGYGQIMVSMTRSPRRERPRHPDQPG